MVGLAALSLTLGACKQPTPVDPGEPVSKINLAKVTKPFIVGDTFDLDDFVTVVGGKGPKVYDVVAAKGYESRVEFGAGKDAHKVTVLEEGAIRLSITAKGAEDSEKTVTFNASAYSKLKAAFISMTDGLVYDYGFDCFEEDEDGKEVIVEYIRHNEYYYYDTWQSSKTATGWDVEGFIKYQESGKAYQYTSDGDITCENFVIGERDETYDYYFCNFPWLLTVDDVSTEEDKDGVTFLRVSGSDPAPDADYWDSLAEEFAYNSLSAYPKASGYTCSSVDIYAEEGENGEIEGLIFNVMAKKGKLEKLYSSYRFVEPKKAKVATLESEYKNGTHEPAPIAFTELETALDAFCGATNYTVEAKQYWVDDDGEYVDINAIAAASEDADFKHIVELWPEDYEVSLNDKTIGRVSKQVTKAGVETGNVAGWVQKDGKLYDVKTEETEGVYGQPTGSLSAKTLAEKLGFFSFSGYTGAEMLATFDPMTRVEDEGAIAWTYDNNQYNALFIEPFLVQGEFHYNQNAGFFQQSDANGYYYRFVTGYLRVNADSSITFYGDWGFSDIDYRIAYEFTLKAPGTTTVDISGINFGA